MATETVKDQIEAALRRLPLRPNIDETRIGAAAAHLATLTPPPTPMPAAFRAAGRTTCQKQLDQVRGQAERLARTLEDLNGPALCALSIHDYMDEGTLFVIDRLRRLAKAAAATNVKNIPIKPSKDGRPPNGRAHIIAEAAAIHYRVLTGKRAAITNNRHGKGVGGRFVELLRAVFDALEIDGDPASAAEHVRDAALSA